MSVSEAVQNHIDKNESNEINKDDISPSENTRDEDVNSEGYKCRPHDVHLEGYMTNIDDSQTLVQDVVPVLSSICGSKNVSMSDNNLSSHNVRSELDTSPTALNSLNKFTFNKDMKGERLRRNSLPETSISDVQQCRINSLGNNSHKSLSNEVQSDVLKPPSLSCDRTKVAPNITDVVKNVHGLFSSLKNVYKENHIGDMIQATQKNLTSARNGYLNMKHDIFNDVKQTSTQKEILEALNKYTSLNLCSEEQEIECYRSETDGKEGGRVEEEVKNELGLEDIIKEQNKHIDDLKSLLQQKDNINKQLENKYSEVSKQLETSVMRYAMSERQILCMERTRNAAVEKENKAKEEVALLERRLKGANLERTRICDMLDEKSHEVLAVQKEVNRLKEELSSADTKLKWAQNKLLSEIQAHKETSLLAEKLGHQVAQHEVVSLNGGTSPTRTDAQIKEMEASNILERHERQRLEEKCKVLQKELEKMKVTITATTQYSEELRVQADSNAGEAAALRDICNELRTQAAKDCERLAATQAKAARLDTVLGQLQQEQEKCSKLQAELEAERKARSSAQAEAELSTRREAELLRQTERLTEAGVRLQATCSEAEAKALALCVDNASLRAAAEREAERVAAAKNEAEAEKRGREGDARALAAAAARHQRAERLAVQKAEQLDGDLRVMATKHSSAIKELKREIQQWKRKFERIETESQTGSHNNYKTTERTGSCSSLSSFEGSTTQHCHDDNTQVDRQQLVEKIVELQRAGARRSERLEFLEGHTVQLTAELQKKSRLLRALMASLPAGALAAPASDRAKMEIGKHGGIMASLFTHEVSDNSMNLELALEMTAKLQAVLEDTLLKNITLKENMDTLGDEITLLKEQLKKRPNTSK